MSDAALRITEPEPGIRVLELHRPERLNALNAELVARLHAALDDAALDPSCRVLILTGAGRGFCAGLDLDGFGEPPGADPGDELRTSFAVQRELSGLILHLRAIPQPVIAAVNGPAAGTGLCLMLASDVRLAAASARLSTAFIRLGVSNCDMGLSWLLPRIVGVARAQELMLTGRPIDAQEALRIGAVVEVAEDGALRERALEVARSIAAHDAFAVAQTKEGMWAALELGSLQTAIGYENRQQIMLTSSGRFHAASRAFLNGGGS